MSTRRWKRYHQGNSSCNRTQTSVKTGRYRSAARSRGSSRLQPESWVPAPEDPFQFVVEDFGPSLQQEMRSTEGPLHLLLLDEPPVTLHSNPGKMRSLAQILYSIPGIY